MIKFFPYITALLINLIIKSINDQEFFNDLDLFLFVLKAFQDKTLISQKLREIISWIVEVLTVVLCAITDLNV